MSAPSGITQADLLAHEPFSDAPHCACPAISAFVRGFNDWLRDDERHVLFDYAARVVGSRDPSAVKGRIEYLCGLAHEFADLRASSSSSSSSAYRITSAHIAASDASYAAEEGRCYTGAYAADAAYHAAAYGGRYAYDRFQPNRAAVIARCLSALDDLLPESPQVPACEIERAVKELAPA